MNYVDKKGLRNVWPQTTSSNAPSQVRMEIFKLTGSARTRDHAVAISLWTIPEIEINAWYVGKAPFSHMFDQICVLFPDCLIHEGRNGSSKGFKNCIHSLFQ
jgi:hypothetical protein